jgi:hypothetical protein
MARFEIPDGRVAQAYKFALDPTPAQRRTLASHAGGARGSRTTTCSRWSRPPWINARLSGPTASPMRT